METKSKEPDLPFSHYIIIAKFYPSQVNYSFNVSCNWRIGKLRKFIILSFEELIHHSKFILLYKGQSLIDESLALKDIFQANQINNVHVLPSHDSNNNNEAKEYKSKTKSKYELLQSEDFALVEKEVVNDYLRLTNQSDVLVDYSIFPFAHPCITQQIERINNKNPLEKLRAFTIDSIEHFPLKGYIQLWLMMKMFLLFMIFSDLVKHHWNLPLILSGFIVYYWLEVTELIREYYRKKINEYQLTNEELNEGGSSGNNNNDDNITNENLIMNNERNRRNVERAIEDLIDEQGKDEHCLSTSSHNSIIDDKKDEHKEPEASINDVKQDNKNSNKADTDTNTNIKTDTDINTNTNNNNSNSNNTNGNNLNPQENKKTYIVLFIEIIGTFFLSLLPFWSDNFEQKNPLPSNEVNQSQSNPDPNENENANVNFNINNQPVEEQNQPISNQEEEDNKVVFEELAKENKVNDKTDQLEREFIFSDEKQEYIIDEEKKNK